MAGTAGIGGSPLHLPLPAVIVVPPAADSAAPADLPPTTAAVVSADLPGAVASAVPVEADLAALPAAAASAEAPAVAASAEDGKIKRNNIKTPRSTERGVLILMGD